MPIQLLFFSARGETPPNELLDGAVVVVTEVAFLVVVEIPARQVAIVRNNSYAAVVINVPRPVAVVDEVEHEIARVTEVDKPIAKVPMLARPFAVVNENTSAEVR